MQPAKITKFVVKQRNMQSCPELLLPAGNIESFYAALHGGADAIYLGIKKFNARGRAKNFTNSQMVSLVREAHDRGVRVYITLNTVIKNGEVDELIDSLHFLNIGGVDGIIIQDWGVWYIVRNYFPQLKIHASTQMGNHNSLGAAFSKEKEFQRIVLARELTKGEVLGICKKSRIETEVFIHGALCYSFSGMCLYSSFVGGRGANRGLCTQPCRRSYTDDSHDKYLFNLKDNQQLDTIDFLKDAGVSSLKIEGRMKSGEYTYRVAKAYRTFLDNGVDKEEARKLLEFDFGREKTGYFLGKDVKEAISERTVAGIFLGKVKRVESNWVTIDSNRAIESGYRLRFHVPGKEKQQTVKVKRISLENGIYRVFSGDKKISDRSEVYLTGMNDIAFPSKITVKENWEQVTAPEKLKKRIRSEIRFRSGHGREEIYFRIGTAEWLRKIHLEEVDGLFLDFTKSDWEEFDPGVPFIQKYKNKLWIEFPKFIGEESIDYYSQLAENMAKSGLRNFVISHLSQKLLVPPGCRIISNDNVYVFNDAAARCLRKEGMELYTYPKEIDFDTLFSLSDKGGIVPVYFHPELFYSRMPLALDGEGEFSDDNQLRLKRHRRDGITSVVPEIPVAILQSRNKLKSKEFNRYLIDLKFEQPSKNRARTLKKRLFKSEQIQPSVSFNFTKGLK